jgi:hypothetical protein
MKKFWMPSFLLAVLVLLGSVSPNAYAFGKRDNDLEDAADDTGDALDDAGDNIKDGIDDAGESVEDAVD